MKRHVKLFQPQFAEDVAEGRKRQTVRPMPAPNRLPAIGDAISLRRWTGRPYWSPQVILGEGKITRVSYVHIREARPPWSPIMVAGRWLDPASAEAFAKADGFADLPSLLDWFGREHGPDFSGVLIQWELLSPPEYPCTECAGDAFIGLSNWRGPEGQVIREDERLCLRCADKRGMPNPFHRPIL